MAARLLCLISLALCVGCDGDPDATTRDGVDAGGSPDMGVGTHLSVSPPNLEFDYARRGQEKIVQVSNPTDEEIELTDFALERPAQFTVYARFEESSADLIVLEGDARAPLTIPAGGLVGLVIVYEAPDAMPPSSDTLRFKTSEGGEISVYLQIDMGEPEIMVSPSTLDLGGVAIGEHMTAALQITNLREGAALELYRIQLDGSRAFEVLIDGQDALMSRIDPLPGYQSIDLEVQFSPVEAGDAEARLTIFNNDPNAPEFAIALFGQGQ